LVKFLVLLRKKSEFRAFGGFFEPSYQAWTGLNVIQGRILPCLAPQEKAKLPFPPVFV